MSAAPADRTPPETVSVGAAAQVPVWNVANALTVSRLLLVPVFLLTLFAGGGHSTGWRLVAALVFAVASITDHVDGRLARKLGLVTDFGKLVDPIADKALTGSALVGLSILGDLPWWVTIVIIGRELGVTLLRLWVIRYAVIPASPGGKAKTIAQIVAIGMFILPLPAGFAPVSWTVMGIALALTVATGVDYVFRAIKVRMNRG
jgi:CDP-diacylglycerol---glycerol-3-phosphate 3-phosphatidyltransferase